MAEKKVKLIENAKEKGHFMQQLLRDHNALKRLIEDGKIEKNRVRIGAELELNLLNAAYEPASIGLEIARKLKRKKLDTEYARFNLEINATPLSFKGNCLSKLKADLSKELKAVSKEASRKNATILLTGIIPTISKKDITEDVLTPEPRYKALHNIRKTHHGDSYEYNIRGTDQLVTRDNLMLFAGCMTSFQVHLQVAPEELKDKYNWAQLIAAPLLACSANSPLFLGKRLWQETRIALFEQAADTRVPTEEHGNESSRVYFGDRWVEEDILEIFQEDITLFNPLFSMTRESNSLQEIEEGKTPKLSAWNYFNGSVYRWNRVCYGVINDKPGLRIENRILPAGPTEEDMIANAAFWLGMMNGMPDKYRNMQEKLPFAEVKTNFFKAARLGLDVQFTWLRKKPVPAHELILKELLPIAADGLVKAQVDKRETDHYLDIIRQRVISRKTGSQWIIDSYSRLLRVTKKEEALRALTAAMVARQNDDKPVHTWELAEVTEGGKWEERFQNLSRFMTTSLYKVKEDDIVDLAVHMMNWKKIGHIPVENEKGEFVGLITRNSIIDYMIHNRDKLESARVSEIMVEDLITVTPDTHLDAAIDLIVKNKVSCLPVVEEKRIVGLVTDHDFVMITNSLVSELFKNGQNGKAKK